MNGKDPFRIANFVGYTPVGNCEICVEGLMLKTTAAESEWLLCGYCGSLVSLVEATPPKFLNNISKRIATAHKPAIRLVSIPISEEE